MSTPLGRQFDHLDAHEEQLFADLTSRPIPFDSARRVMNRQRLPKRPGAQGTLFDVESDEHYEGRRLAHRQEEQERFNRQENAASLLSWRQEMTDTPHPNRRVANGAVISGVGTTMVKAHDLTTGEHVGSLSWFPGAPEYNGTNIDGGRIHEVLVRKESRRQGFATAMLTAARQMYPEKDIRHSDALTDDGAAWAKARP